MPFDIVGNLPEDLVAEVLSYLPDMSDMRRLIHWQTVCFLLTHILPPFLFLLHSFNLVSQSAILMTTNEGFQNMEENATLPNDKSLSPTPPLQRPSTGTPPTTTLLRG